MSDDTRKLIGGNWDDEDHDGDLSMDMEGSESRTDTMTDLSTSQVQRSPEQSQRVWRSQHNSTSSPGRTTSSQLPNDAEHLTTLEDDSYSADETKVMIMKPGDESDATLSPGDDQLPGSRSGGRYRRRIDSARSTITRGSIVSVLGEERSGDNLINAGQCLMHLLKGMIGTGVLALPYAFKLAGIVGGPMFMTFICCMALVAMNFLVDSNRHLCKVENVPYMDYGDLAEAAFRHGPIGFLKRRASWGKTAINVLLIITQLGFCAIYIVFMAQSVDSVMVDFNAHEDFDIRLVITFFFIPVVLLCLIRNLALLAVFSLLTNILLIVGLSVIIYELFHDMPSPTRLEAFGTFSEFPIFFGSAIFSVEGIGLVLPLENKMRKPEQFKWVLNGGMVFVFGLYIVFGFLGYNKYGGAIESSISYSLPDEWYFSMTKLIFAVAMYVTYSLQFLVPVRILLPWVNRTLPYGTDDLREYAFRFFLIVITFVAAISIPFLNYFISLLGSVASSCLALIVPGIIFEFALWSNDNLNSWQKAMYRVLIVTLVAVGVVGGIMGSIISFEDIVKAFTADSLTPLIPPTPATRPPPSNSTPSSQMSLIEIIGNQ